MLMIAFGHEKGVGKDTSAKLLCSFLKVNYKGLHIRTFGFADKLKDIAYQLYAWAGLENAEYYENNYNARNEILPLLSKSPRQIWIDIGMAIRERVYEDTWIDWVAYNLPCDIGIIKDLRFPNEANRVLQHKGLLFKVVNPRIQHTNDPADDPLLNYTGWSSHILNDSTLQTLNNRVEKLANDLIVPLLRK